MAQTKGIVAYRNYGNPAAFTGPNKNLPNGSAEGGGLTVESGATPSGYDPDAEAYFAGFATQPDTYEKDAVNQFVLDLKAAGLWALARRINPMIGTTLAGAARVLVDTYGHSGADVLNNYVGGDWDQTEGLQGDGASTFMGTGFNITDVGDVEHCIGAHYRGPDYGSAYRMLWGGGDALPTYYGYTVFGATVGTTRIGSLFDPTVSLQSPGNVQEGTWCMNRTSTTNLEMWQNGIEILNDATPVAFNAATMELIFGAYSDAGSPIQFLNAGERIAGYCCFDGLDNTQMVALYAAWDDMNTALGRVP